MSNFVEIKDENIYEILLFDDGNQNIEKKYNNLWNIVATNNKGKVRLRNIKEPSFYLESISRWKVKDINYHVYT